MISLIICARKQDISPELKENIEKTIGVPYEVIVINNSDNRYNIFQAYNKGVSLSRYPMLLFMHDDIHYHTQNWGQSLLEHFRDEKVGGIGIAGTPYLPVIPGGWWSAGVGNLHLLQSEKAGAEPVLQNYFPESVTTTEVVALDGVWFCIRRTLFEKIRFDEETFSGFHLYDVDISIQVHQQGYKLLVVKDILIHHFSTGVLDHRWIQNLMVFHGKWKSQLPITNKTYNLEQQCTMEYRVLNEMISNQIRNLALLKRKRSEVYLFGLRHLLRFRKGYRYYKTPVWISRLVFQYLGNRLLAK